MFNVITSESETITGENMLEVVEKLPLFNNYIKLSLNELVDTVNSDFNINNELIYAIKNGDVMKLEGLSIDGYVEIIKIIECDN